MSTEMACLLPEPHGRHGYPDRGRQVICPGVPGTPAPTLRERLSDALDAMPGDHLYPDEVLDTVMAVFGDAALALVGTEVTGKTVDQMTDLDRARASVAYFVDDQRRNHGDDDSREVWGQDTRPEHFIRLSDLRLLVEATRPAAPTPTPDPPITRRPILISPDPAMVRAAQALQGEMENMLPVGSYNWHRFARIALEAAGVHEAATLLPGVSQQTLAELIHEAWTWQLDECQHGTYSGGTQAGEPYAMCEIFAGYVAARIPEPLIERQVVYPDTTSGPLNDKLIDAMRPLVEQSTSMRIQTRTVSPWKDEK